MSDIQWVKLLLKQGRAQYNEHNNIETGIETGAITHGMCKWMEIEWEGCPGYFVLDIIGGLPYKDVFPHIPIWAAEV